MIRVATPADVQELCNLEYLLFPDNSLSCAQMELELRGNCRAFLIGDPIIAYALVGRAENVLDLLRLGVHPLEQGQGHAKALLAHVLSPKLSTVLMVKKANARALKLYKSLGFEVVGHFKPQASWAMRWDPDQAACPSMPTADSHRSPCSA